jgi:hypothetical protein
MTTMEQKIELIHPAGKKAISMDKQKYDIIKNGILNYLKTKGEATHTEILKSLTDEFKKSDTKFQGSVEWHMEWVKLDLEARKIIKRLDDKATTTFTIV